jgi:hypothetical protein
MSEGHEDVLSPWEEEQVIQGLVRLVESLAIELRLGTCPVHKTAIVVGIRHFNYKLLGHYEALSRKQPSNQRKQVGFCSQSEAVAQQSDVTFGREVA